MTDERKPVDRFNDWLATPKGQEVATFSASTLGKEVVRVQIRNIRFWLIANESNKKANKRLWGKFFLNWMSRVDIPKPVGRLMRQKYKESCDI